MKGEIGLGDTDNSTGNIVPGSGIRILLITGIFLYLSLFLYNSLTRTYYFAPDPMNYVDVARNISNGKGIVQSTSGFNQAFLFGYDSPMPTPMTSQPPLYPILIALVSQFGLTHADAALVISATAYGLVLIFIYFLAKNLYGVPVAYLSVGCLLIYAPLRFVSRFALTESVSMVFLIVVLWFFLRISQLHQKAARNASLFAGLFVGLAFATRYAFLFLFFLGFLFLAFEQVVRKRNPQSLLFYLLGFAIPASLVFGHNLFAGSSLLPTMLPSDRGLAANLKDAFRSVAGNWLMDDRWAKPQVLLAGLIWIGCTIALIARRRLRDALQTIFIRRGCYFLTLWAIGYLLFIVYQRTVSHFDGIDSRLTVPAGVILLVLYVAFLVKAAGSRITGKYLTYGILASLILLSCAREMRTTLNQPPNDFGQQIARSERLRWIAQNTTHHDLIIGDNTMDIPFYFAREAVVSFSAYPYCEYLTYTYFMNYVHHNCHRYQNIYLVLRRHDPIAEKQLLYFFGQFITDLEFGHFDKYQGLVQISRLEDSLVFKVLCQQSLSYAVTQ